MSSTPPASNSKEFRCCRSRSAAPIPTSRPSCTSPTSELIVAGDVIDNGVRPLHPATVIAGHKDPRTFDTPSEIHSTRRYLTNARRLPGGCTSAEQFYKGMLALDPHRLNPGVLWDAAITPFPPARPPHSRTILTHGDSSFMR